MKNVKGFLSGRYYEGSADEFLSAVHAACYAQRAEANSMVERNGRQCAEALVEKIEFEGTADGNPLTFYLDPYREPTDTKMKLCWLLLRAVW